MANVIRLGKGATRKIKSAIDDLYDNVKVRFLGPNAAGKRIFITFDRSLSLPGIFEAGSTEEAIKPDLEVLTSLIRVAQDYLDASRERMKAKVIHSINGALAEAKHTGGMSRDEFRGLVNTKLTEVWSEAANSVHTIVDTEINHTKNVSILDGIVGANLRAGIDDPTVYFVVVRDEDLCDECKRLHLMPDGKTPRLWKLSEVSHGYHKKGEDSPSIGGLHPHCRCSLVTLMPGYGFNPGGFVTYKKMGYDGLADQRNLERAMQEFGSPLAKTFDESKHPRDPATGEFAADPKGAEDNPEYTDADFDVGPTVSDEEAYDDNVEFVRSMLQDGTIPNDPVEVQKFLQQMGMWPSDPVAAQALMQRLEVLTKAQNVFKPLTGKASRIRVQAIGEYRRSADSGIPPKPVESMGHLFRYYKIHPHNRYAVALKYLTHRMHRYEDYKTTEGAEAADAEFLKARDRAFDLSKVSPMKRAQQFSLPQLKLFVARHAHLIDEIDDHTKELHRRLLPFAVYPPHAPNVPHVALVRGLMVPKSEKSGILHSYADTTNIDLGGRVKHFHHHLVPLKSIVYSYDMGPHTAFMYPRRPPQDEYLVMPHDQTPADPSVLKKMIPKHPNKWVPKRQQATSKRMTRSELDPEE